MVAMRPALAGSLRKDGRWRIVITLTRADGAKIKKAVHAATQRECQVKARALLQKDESRTYKDPKTISGAWDEWEADGWKRLRPGSIRQHKWAKSRIIAAFGSTLVGAMDSSKVLRWLRRMIDDPALSGNSPKHLKASLSSLLSYCQERGWTDVNYAREVRMPTGSRLNPQKPPLGETAFRSILAAEEDDTLRLIWEVLGETGLRPIEALALKPSDIIYTLDRWWVVVERSKTTAGTREVPMPDGLAHRLSEREDPMFGKWSNASHSTRSYLNRQWHKVTVKAGVPDTNMYQLRKCAISRWVAQGHSSDVVKALAGHSTIRITMDHYNRISKERLAMAVDN